MYACVYVCVCTGACTCPACVRVLRVYVYVMTVFVFTCCVREPARPVQGRNISFFLFHSYMYIYNVSKTSHLFCIFCLSLLSLPRQFSFFNRFFKHKGTGRMSVARATGTYSYFSPLLICIYMYNIYRRARARARVYVCVCVYTIYCLN